MLKKIYNEVTREWATSVEEALKSFIRLPALSPDFDKRWEENGVLLKALEDAQAWAHREATAGSSSQRAEAFLHMLQKLRDVQVYSQVQKPGYMHQQLKGWHPSRLEATDRMRHHPSWHTCLLTNEVQ